MPDIKISQLPAGTANASAVVPATNAAGTTTEKITLESIVGLAHQHTISQVTDLETTLGQKLDAPESATAGDVLTYEDGSWVAAAASGGGGGASAAVEWTANHTTADGTRYEIGDLVYSGGNVYRAIAANESIPVSSTSYWALVGSGYRLNIDGRDIQNIPDELPASAIDGDVLTYSSGSWVAAAPSGIVSNTGAVHPGASQITNIVSLSQSDYDTLAPKSATTLYIITG